MSIIPTKVHAILDYLVGVLLILLPTILGFSSQGRETWIMVILGVTTIIYSMFTRYELSFASLISMRAHLWLDFISGVLLATSPWWMGFAHRIFLPHVVMGGAELLVVMLSSARPSKSPDPKLASKDPA